MGYVEEKNLNIAGNQTPVVQLVARRCTVCVIQALTMNNSLPNSSRINKYNPAELSSP
jgi:hypothetical protein